MQHLDGEVLALRIVDSDTAVHGACHKQVARRGIGQLLKRLVELGELVGDAGALDVEDSEDAGFEAAGKERQSGVSRHAQRLVDWRGELVDLV